MQTQRWIRFWQGVAEGNPGGVDPFRVMVELAATTGARSTASGISIVTPAQISAQAGVPRSIAEHYMSGNPSPAPRAALEEALGSISELPRAIPTVEWDPDRLALFARLATREAIAELGAPRIVGHIAIEHAATLVRARAAWQRWRSEYARLLALSPGLETAMLEAEVSL